MMVGNRTETNKCVIALYEQLGRLRPWIVWCEGPFQVAALHSIVPKVLASERWETVSRYFKHNIYPEYDWSEEYANLYAGIIEPQVVALRESLSPNYRDPEMFEVLNKVLFRELDKRMRAEARETDEVNTTVRRELRNTAGYQHLGLKLTSAIMKKVATYGTIIDRLIRAEVETTLPLVTQQSARLQVALRETMRLYGGPCADLEALVMWGSWTIPWLETYVTERATINGQWSEDDMITQDALATIAQNAHGLLSTEGIAFVCEKAAAVRLDEQSRPHRLDGPAIAFNDRFAVYAVNGVAVPRRFVENPALITPDLINNERNSEVRRVLMDIYGTERFLKEGHAELIHKDETGELYEVVLPAEISTIRGEPLVFVRVKNSTPEPDGSFRYYVLRVPPRCRTAREAVAWTFGMRAEQYSPDKET
jgi:hypothetical protein